MTSFETLLQRLTDAGIDFVIVGGFANVLYGSSIVTRDLVLCTVLTGDTVKKLRAALADLNPRRRLTSKKLSFPTHPASGAKVSNLYLETEAGAVDLLSSILGVGDFARLRRKSARIELFGRKYKVISLADLIRAKEALGREKDLLAANELRAIAAKPSRRWARIERVIIL